MRGSVIETITGKATEHIAEITGSYAYTPYGEQLGDAYSGYGYNGEYYDAATGMANLRAKQYEPGMMRFGQPDLVRGHAFNPQTVNRYAYCVNNPVMYADPSGETVQTLMQNIAMAGQEIVDVAASGLNRLVKGSPKTIAGIQAEFAPMWSGGTALTQGQKNTLQKQQGDRKLQLKTGPSALGVGGMKHMPYACDGGTEVGHMSQLSEELGPKPRQTLLDMDLSPLYGLDMEAFRRLTPEEQRLLIGGIEEAVDAVRGEEWGLGLGELSDISITPGYQITKAEADRRAAITQTVTDLIHYDMMIKGAMIGFVLTEALPLPFLQTTVEALKKGIGTTAGTVLLDRAWRIIDNNIAELFTIRAGAYTRIYCEHTETRGFWIFKSTSWTRYEIRMYSDYCEVWYSRDTTSIYNPYTYGMGSIGIPNGHVPEIKVGEMTTFELKDILDAKEREASHG